MTDIKKGTVICGFEILEALELAEFDARGIYARHLKSRAEVFHLLNDDEENLFAFAFATAAKGSTGVAHIIEHSVLCGSKNYPIKDPFMVLAQGSLQTYLNAWTFPDKTVYPASSVNEADYFNLMSVYGDAVFFPNLDEWTFRQEGHRLCLEQNAAKPHLSITGVVYNEMKGAYSALDEYAQHWSAASVLPDTVYAFDSGGNPDCIPDLSYEQFLAFHRNRYAPANCRIFLAGNIAVEKQLSFLDEHFLSKLPAGTRAPEAALAERWDTPKNYAVAAPSSPDNKATVFVSWLCGIDLNAEPQALVELYMLTEVLLGHDGSPLLRALVESPLGDDIATVTGVDTELRQPVWTAGLRGVAPETPPEAVEQLILSELRRLVNEGIPRDEIEAALLSLEFSNREIKRAGGPWSLVLLRRSLRGWIHGCVPWATLGFNEPFARLKKHIEEDSRYLEKLIERIFLDNPHRALVTVQPREGFLAAQQKKLEEKLTALEQSMSPPEFEVLEKKNKELEEQQSAKDSPEVLKKIPHINIASLSGVIEVTPRSLLNAGGLPIVSNKLWTNGITYVNFAFPVDVLSPEDYLYLPLFCHCITGLGMADMNYAEVSGLLARTTGEFYAMLCLGLTAGILNNPVETPAGAFDLIGRDWIFFRLKCLDEKINAAVELVPRVIYEADFSDHRRLNDLVIEFKNNIEDNLAPMGNFFASVRCMMAANAVKAKLEVTSGITQLDFARKMAQQPAAETAAALARLRDTLFAKTGMLVHIIGEAEAHALQALERYAAKSGSPAKHNPATHEITPFLALVSPPQDRHTRHVDTDIEIFSSASLQVGFAAQWFQAALYAEDTSIAEFMLSHHLSTTALWEIIRMKGGAYGARAAVSSLEGCFSFSTYRDPNPVQSLKLFSEILEETGQRRCTQSEVEKAVIGAYAKVKQPQTNAQKGVMDFSHFLSGITPAAREKRLLRLLAAKEDDMRNAAAAILRRTPRPGGVIIAGEQAAQAAASKYGVRVYDLGV